MVNFIISVMLVIITGSIWYNEGLTKGKEQVAQECSTQGKFSVGTASFDCFEEE